MEQAIRSQLVFGDRTLRFEVRRQITAAIDHIRSAEDRLVDSQAGPLEYDGEYNHIVVQVIDALVPLHKLLCDLRRSTYARESTRARIDVSHPVVQRVLSNERSICLERLRAYVQDWQRGDKGHSERYPITVGSHDGTENPDVRED